MIDFNSFVSQGYLGLLLAIIDLILLWDVFLRGPRSDDWKVDSRKKNQ